MSNQTLINGKWVEAKPLPYYPSVLEKILHLFRIHQWTYREPYKCVMCGKKKSN